jgi:Domain of unknown function (DUF4198)
MKSLTAVTVLLLLLTTPAIAHDFWIEPSTFAPKPGQVVAVRLRVGEHLEGEAVPRRPKRIERFFARSASGEVDVPGHDNRDPAGLLTVRDEGTTIVAYRSLPTRTELDAAKFESYLREEGLEHLAKASSASVSEIYSRAAKTLLHSGGGKVTDRAVGLRLELVRNGNDFQVLFEGIPLQRALIVAIRRGGGEPMRMRSDAEGNVRFGPLAKGEWLVKTVHMIPAPPSANAEWESLWASVTFAVP